MDEKKLELTKKLMDGMQDRTMEKLIESKEE